MSRIDVDSLLAEVSEELPCGEDLEYDADFGELERAARGKPEQSMGDTSVPAEEPDWAEVQRLATELLTRTKDLRVVLYLIRAQLRSEGIVGLSDSLGVLRGVLERYWETVHPQLDPDDDNDPTLRVNTVMALCDGDTMLRSLRETPLVTSKAFGSMSYRDIAVANGEVAPPEDTEEALPDSSAIHGAFMDADLEELQATAEAAEHSIEHANAIEQEITNQVGAGAAPNLEEFTTSLKSIQRVLTERLAQRGVGDPAAADGGVAAEGAAAPAGGAPGAGAAAGPIASPQDVLRAIDRICDYYERNEPSSPVPLLLKRAKRLVSKDFMEIVRDLVPDGINQVEQIRGADSDEYSG